MEERKEGGLETGSVDSKSEEQRGPMKFYLKRTTLINVSKKKKGKNGETIQKLRQKHYCLETLNFDFGSNNDKKVMQKLVRNSRLSRLNKVKINSDQINLNERVEEVVKFLGKNRSIRHLKLLFPWDYKGENDITGEKLAKLTSQIGTKLKKLQNLIFDWSGWCQITVEQAIKIMNNIKRSSKTLHGLSLALNNSGVITDEGIRQVMKKIGLYLKDIERLQLKFYWIWITDKGVEAIANTIKKQLNSLHCLSLDLHCCAEITDAGMTELVYQIGTNLPVLRNLILNFSSLAISDDVAEQLANSLGSNLQYLQSLKLSLNNTDITDKGAKHLIDEIGRNCHALVLLDLDFGGLRTITDQTLQHVTNILKDNLKSLRHLALDFSQDFYSFNEGITNSGFNNLASQIGSLPQILQTLKFHFAGDQIVTEDGLRIFSNQLTNLRTLQELSVNFSSTFGVTGRGVRLLASRILESLQRLQRLDLIFNRCPNTSKGLIQELATQIRNSIKSLENVHCSTRNRC